MLLAKKNNFIFGEKKKLQVWKDTILHGSYSGGVVFFLHVLTFLQKKKRHWGIKNLAVVGIASSVLFVAGKMNTNYHCPINIIAMNILQNMTLKNTNEEKKWIYIEYIITLIDVFINIFSP